MRSHTVYQFFFCDAPSQVLDELGEVLADDAHGLDCQRDEVIVLAGAPYRRFFLVSADPAAAPRLTEHFSRYVAVQVLVQVASHRSILPHLNGQIHKPSRRWPSPQSRPRDSRIFLIIAAARPYYSTSLTPKGINSLSMSVTSSAKHGNSFSTFMYVHFSHTEL